MPRPGPEKDFDYFTQPYNPKWEPLESRIWAEQFVNGDGTEDYAGFQDEFKKRHPFLVHNHGPVYMPISASDYLRHDPMGGRLDIDFELAALPLTEEEVAEREALKKAEMKEKRHAVLRSRGLKIPGDKPKTRSAEVANEVNSRM